MAAIVKSMAGRITGTRTPALGAFAMAFLALSACGKTGTSTDQMGWARAALERNPQLQVVAADSQARTFTVRLKSSGELHVVPVDQIVAGPPAAAGAGGVNAESASTDAVSGSAPAAAESATANSGPPTVGTTEADRANPQPPADTPELASSGAAAQTPPESNDATAPSAEGPRAEAAADAKPGKVLASGPGYSIKATGPRSGSPRASNVVTAARGTPTERLHDPIICQGARLLHIDNRNLEFDGDAISAEDGCELHITNTHIIARGVGVSARAANVHIENSEIEGESGAIDASDGAQVYAEATTFRGVTRRLASSAFHDLGGNVWH